MEGKNELKEIDIVLYVLLFWSCNRDISFNHILLDKKLFKK